MLEGAEDEVEGVEERAVKIEEDRLMGKGGVGRHRRDKK
jgi:hypothetical protein